MPTEPAAIRDDAMEIPLKRRVLWIRIAWLAPTGIVYLVGGVFFLVSSFLTPGPPFGPGPETWFFFAAVLIVGAVDTWRVARIRGAAVRIDAEGVFDRRIQSKVLPWSEIKRAEVQWQDDQPVILGFWAKRRSMRYIRRAPLWNYFGLVYVLQFLGRRYRFAPISIDLQPLRADPDDMIDLVVRYWGEPEEREVGPR